LPTVGLDYTPAYEQGGGIGRYVRELTAALSRQSAEFDYHLFVAGAQQSQLPSSLGKHFVWKPSRLTPKWLARIWHRAHLLLPVEVFVGRIDLFHATDFVLPPTLSRTRSLLTVHDLSFVRVPLAASPGLKAYLNQVVPLSVRRADHVLADSIATKDDLVALYGVSPAKVTVLLSGVGAQFHFDDSQLNPKSRYIPSFPYILSVGTVQPRKNYGRLIQALVALRSRNYDVHLVIAGGSGWLTDSIYETIESTHMQNFVHFIGFADDTDLPALYSGATCFAFPSLYEGFGLPVLEAMACGTPVVTSNVSSLPEVAGDAALMVNPYDVEAIADALRRLIDDSALRTELIEKGRIRASHFSWDNSAQHLLQIYRDLLA
jgi:glycosyltransferase involved in cell wall biosynthesis